MNKYERSVRTKFASARKKISIAEKKLIRYVKNNPKKSVAIAAAVLSAVAAAVAVIWIKKKKK